MPTLIAIVLGVLALAFVLFPLYRSILTRSSSLQIATPMKSSQGVVSVTTEREQSARTALQEIELDYQLGNISEEDYNTLRERYVRHALVALKSRNEREQETLQEFEQERDSAQELDELIEEQLRRLKENETNATE